MLIQAMKGRVGRFVLKIFAALLIVSFGAWGIGDMISGGGLPTDVADVGNSKITANEFQESFQNRLNQLRRSFGQQLDSQQARQLGIADVTLERLINLRLLRLHASELNLSVGDEQVREEIKRLPGMSDGRGGINAMAFREALSRNNLSEDRYVATLRNQITLSHLSGIITEGSVAPDHLADQLYRYRNERRVADVMVVKRAAASAAPKPTDAQIREFYSKNEALFTAPELRTVTVLYLDPDTMAKEVGVSEDELKDEYEASLASLSVPERRRVRQIVTADEETAKRAQQSLAEGRSFTDVAKEIAGMTEEATQLGLVSRDQIPPDIARAVFAAKANEPSPPSKSALGWHIVLVEHIEPGKTPTLADVRDGIKHRLARQRAAETLHNVANDVDDGLAGGDSIDEIAAQIGIRTIEIGPIDARGRDADGKPAQNLPSDEEFLSTAFETAEGRTSDRIETRTEAHLVVRIDSVTPPAVRPFESVRAQAITAWKITQQDESAKKKATELLEKLKGGNAFASVAKKAGLEVHRSKPFTRFNRAAGSKIPPSLANELFKLKPGGAAMAPSQEGYAIARLDDVQAAAPGADKEGLRDMKERMRAAVANDVLTQFTSSLRARYAVHIDRGAINRLFNEGSLGQY